MSIEKLAFMSQKDIDNCVDDKQILLDIINFLQQERHDWITESSSARNEIVDLREIIRRVLDILDNQFEAYLEPQDTLKIEKCKLLLREALK